jgi:NAD(P)-dependent dehydrogenase (short-subunit alcohol dehydrogenase family)
MELQGKTAVVTGGGAGIGEGISLRLAEAGAEVAIISRSKNRAAGVADKINAWGRKSFVEVADVTDSKQVKTAVQHILDNFGKIDILINNVGGEIRFYKDRTGDRFVEISEQEWDEMIDFNLKTAVRTCREVVPHMVKQNSGKIVNIASISARPPIWTGARNSAAFMSYSVSKAAMVQFTGVLALELAEHNINVNCVCPADVWTPMWEKNALRAIAADTQFKGMTPREYFEKVAVAGTRQPLKREITPADIGDAVLFFVSEKARNITGQSLTVDAGARPG